jgi:hypothetical protein
MAAPTANRKTVTKSSNGLISGAFTTTSAPLQPAWLAPRELRTSATATTAVFQMICQTKRVALPWRSAKPAQSALPYLNDKINILCLSRVPVPLSKLHEFFM